MRRALLPLSTLLLSSFGCADPLAPPAPQGTSNKLDFTLADGFYSAPFPSDARRRDDGRPSVAGFPNPSNVDLVNRIVTMLDEDADGFGRSAGVFFPFDGPLDPSALPDLFTSVTEASPVTLISVDPSAPDYLTRYPVQTSFEEDAGPFGTTNLLVVLPLQGVPLRSNTRYAAVVQKHLGDASGEPLGAPAALSQIIAGVKPDGLTDAVFASYQSALAALAEAGVAAQDIAALTVYTTGAPEAALSRVTERMRAIAPAPSAPFSPNEVFPTFCVYSTTLPMPVYQAGDPPFTSEGGAWAFDAFGEPILQGWEEANLVVTVPRSPMPVKGYPLVVLSRTGAGGERPLVDRGVRAENGGPAIEPGTGPALTYASAGFAGASVDGPHGGLRNITHADEQFLVYNFGNPPALRDNVRQSAAEIALAAHVLPDVAIDVSGCPGADAPLGLARFDASMLVTMGHSMGGVIVPIAASAEPRYRGVLLSGAGGSFLENVIWKQKPLAVKGIAETLIGYASMGRELTDHDPLLSMLQWAGEPADPPMYGPLLTGPDAVSPRHVLMMQGIVDHYIMPPIANATSLSLGLDLAGDALDETSAELSALTPISALLGFAGRGRVALPASENKENSDGSFITAVLTQHPEDGIEDGHEVVFQTSAPKHQYQCFLMSLLSGSPRVPGPGNEGDPCE